MFTSGLDQYQKFGFGPIPASGTLVSVPMPTKTASVDPRNETNAVNRFNNSMSMCWVQQKCICTAALTKVLQFSTQTTCIKM